MNLSMKKYFIVFATFASLIFLQCTKERYINEAGNLVPKTADQDPSVPSITVNGAMLHAEAFGHPDSTIIVCIHGGPGADYGYMLNCKDLTNYGYRVVFYDQRGSGLSQRFPKKSYTSLGLGALDLMYDELTGVIKHYRTKPTQQVFLIGDSWGGMFGTGYAGKNPTAIQGLVVCEPGGLKWADVVEYITNSRSFKLWGELLNNATYIDQFISGKEDQHEILDYKLNLLASANDITNESAGTEGERSFRSGAVVNAGLLEMGEEFKPDLSEGIKNFDKPVLYIHTELNKAHPLSWAQKVSSAYKNVELFKVNGVGHSGMITVKKAWKETTLPKLVSYFKSL
jgi:proline iminopeptidase